MVDDADIVTANYTTYGGIVHILDKVSSCYLPLGFSIMTQNFIQKAV